MLAALEGAVWSEVVVVSVEWAIDGAVVVVKWAIDGEVVSVECANDGAVVSVECANDGTVVCALDDALSLFLFLLLEVNIVDILVEVGAVAEHMI